MQTQQRSQSGERETCTLRKGRPRKDGEGAACRQKLLKGGSVCSGPKTSPGGEEVAALPSEDVGLLPETNINDVQKYKRT